MNQSDSQILVIATNNDDKLQEIKPILDGLDITVLSKNDFNNFPEIEENGNSIEENALLKARGTFHETKRPSIADDTGLEVEILNGDPGVFSSRYAGDSATYADNIQKLLNELKSVPDHRRHAQFRCVMAFVDGDYEFTVEGTCKGKIIDSIEGNNGFGYDPVFFVPEYGKTFAQMSYEEKNRISHRGKALVTIKPRIEHYFKEKIVNDNLT